MAGKKGQEQASTPSDESGRKRRREKATSEAGMEMTNSANETPRTPRRQKAVDPATNPALGSRQGEDGSKYVRRIFWIKFSSAVIACVSAVITGYLAYLTSQSAKTTSQSAEATRQLADIAAREYHNRLTTSCGEFIIRNLAVGILLLDKEAFSRGQLKRIDVIYFHGDQFGKPKKFQHVAGNERADNYEYALVLMNKPECEPRNKVVISCTVDYLGKNEEFNIDEEDKEHLDVETTSKVKSLIGNDLSRNISEIEFTLFVDVADRQDQEPEVASSNHHAIADPGWPGI